MLDYIDHTGFVYRTAYPFSYKPTQVHICLLPYRFVVFGLLRLVLSFVIWLFVGGVFGIVFWVIFGMPSFLAGKKFVYKGISPFNEGHIIGENLLNRLTFMNYRRVQIKNLPTIAGKRVLPWHIVATILIPLALWYIVPVAASAIVSGGQSAWFWVTWLAAKFMSYSLWIPVTLVVGLLLLTLLIWGVREFRKSEMYALLLMSFKARMDKICPILPVK